MAIDGLVGSCCASTADSVAATASSTTTLKLLVDSGSSSRYIDNASMPVVFERFPDYRLLTTPYRTTAGDHVLHAEAEVTVPGTIKDSYGRMRRVSLSAYLVPGLGRHLYSVMVATRKGITTIFDRDHLRLEAGPYVIPLLSLIHI